MSPGSVLIASLHARISGRDQTAITPWSEPGTRHRDGHRHLWIARCIDWSSLTLVSGEHVDPPFAHLYSDLLYTARAGSGQTLIYVLFEHQSRPDGRMPLRLLRYMARIWERFEKDRAGERLPPIIPVVLHHGDQGWSAATHFRGLLNIPDALRGVVEPFIPDFTFVLDDLSKVDDAALRARALSELALLTLVALQRCRGAPDPVAVLRPWTRALVAVLTAPTGRDALRLLAGYILETSEGQPEELRVFFRELGSGAEEVVMTAAEKLRAEGEARGEARGEVRGQAKLLLRQLSLRFGPVPAELEARVLEAGSAELERWAERVLSARERDEVFRE